MNVLSSLAYAIPLIEKHDKSIIEVMFTKLAECLFLQSNIENFETDTQEIHVKVLLSTILVFYETTLGFDYGRSTNDSYKFTKGFLDNINFGK